ncbi:hypothetical protein H0H87_000251 [Tephrocybe sp. NHM501043]|nr:hypothetical protein H0H87_000251 [Tephrocybe sp. NHM501043]
MSSDDSLAQQSFRSASSLMGLQLFSRLFTFVLNQAMFRLAPPRAYGTAAIQFELLLSTILFLSREGVRNTLLRVKSAGPASRNLSVLPVLLGFPLALATAWGYAHFAGMEVKAQEHFMPSIGVYAAAALLELMSEPMHNLAMAELRTGVRVRAEGLGITAKTVVTFLVLVYDFRSGGDGALALIAFAAGQLAYGAAVLATYLTEDPMKSGLHPAIHKRLLTAPLPHAVLPRPRSNSLSIYATTNAVALQAPPPRPRETKNNHNHHLLNPSTLALPPDALDLLLPMGMPHPGKPMSLLWDACGGVYGGGVTKAGKQRTRKKRSESGYRLDVGAYGIPKRGCGHRPFSTYACGREQAGPEPMNLAVQVGEDAYFVRGDAVGVADGVGGWARQIHHSPSSQMNTPTQSALFARRLMHYTSAELELEADVEAELEGVESELEDGESETGDMELEGYLEELEEGIDVLSILESAYEKTVAAHAPSREGSSTAMVAVLDELSGEEGKNDKHREQLRLQVAQVGDCMGMVVRGEEIVWRSEEMWWAWNTPVQLGMPPSNASTSSTSTPSPPPTTFIRPQPYLRSLPMPSKTSQQTTQSTSKQPDGPGTERVDRLTPRTLARLASVPVRTDDILILASDGLSDNLWDEDVVDEVKRCRGGFAVASSSLPDGCVSGKGEEEQTRSGIEGKETLGGMTELRRRTMAGMLSEALCSRARGVSERRGRERCRVRRPQSVSQEWEELRTEERARQQKEEEEETPFARRAREVGRVFTGGKKDDISVLVAIVAPVRRPRKEEHHAKTTRKG